MTNLSSTSALIKLPHHCLPFLSRIKLRVKKEDLSP